VKTWTHILARRQLIASEDAFTFGEERLVALSTLRNPPAETIANGRNRLRRVVVLAAIFLTLAAGPILFAFDVVSRDGLGYLLFAGHDWLYLPLRGRAWTAVMPWGLAIWLPILVLSSLLLLDWVSGVSPLRTAQKLVIRWGLDRPFGRRALDFWHRQFGPGVLRARYFEKVVEVEVGDLLDRMRDAWVAADGEDPVVGRVAQLIFWARITTRYGTPDRTLRVLCELLTALAARRSRRQASSWDLEFEELVAECRRLLAQIAAPGERAAAQDGDSREATLDLLSEAPAVRAAERALVLLHRSVSEDAQRREHALEVRAQRVLLAMLASATEKGRAAETVRIASPEKGESAQSSLALFLTAVIAAAVAHPGLIGETMGLLDEMDRLRFAVAAAERGDGLTATSNQLESLVAAYGSAGRAIGLDRMRAALDAGSLAGGLGLEEKEEMFPLADGAGDGGSVEARPRGDLWATSGFDGARS
jgi:hypothetical protein